LLHEQTKDSQSCRIGDHLEALCEGREALGMVGRDSWRWCATPGPRLRG
jgi:hypothetical protein